jgi:hypothetical protein
MTTPAEQIAALQAARDRIIAGEQAVKVVATPNSHETVFGKADLARLDQRIEALQAEARGLSSPRRAIGFVF